MEDDNSDGLDPRVTVGIISGIATGAALLIILLLVGFMVCRYWMYRRPRVGDYVAADAGRVKKKNKEDQIELRASRVDPDGGGNPQSNHHAVQAQQPPENKQTYTEEDIQRQKRNTRLGSRQFPRGDLLLLDYLGEGEYGPIYRGQAYGLGVKEQARAVTVKMLTPPAPEAKRIRFEQDIALLSTLNHLNVVGMLAVCTEESPECILLDAGEPGDLLTFVRQKRSIMREANGTEDAHQIRTEMQNEFLKITDEVCIGMAYLASQHYVHKDLALRNCIMGLDGVVRVANFGLGPMIYPESYYKVRGKDLPIRWMPPEAISNEQFTTVSDIWAFGVLMWELFAFGNIPYRGMSDEDVIRFVAQDFGKLSEPELCPEDVYLVMSSCWELEPQSRPAFLTLHEHLFDLASEAQDRE